MSRIRDPSLPQHSWSGWLGCRWERERERVRPLRTPIYCGTASPESKSLPTFNDLWPWQDAPICTLPPPPFAKEEGGRGKFSSTSSKRSTPLSSFFAPLFHPFLLFYENVLPPRLFISLTRFLSQILFSSLYIHIYLFFYFDIFHWILLDLFYQNSTLIIPLNPSFLPPEDSENLDI